MVTTSGTVAGDGGWMGGEENAAEVEGVLGGTEGMPCGEGRGTVPRVDLSKPKKDRAATGLLAARHTMIRGWPAASRDERLVAR